MGVQDEGEVEEAFPCRYVGDVRQPDPVGPTGDEVPAKQVRGGSGPRVTTGGSTLLAAHATPESHSSHQSCYPPESAPYSERTQLGVYPRVAVGLSAPAVDLADLLGEGGVLAAPVGGRPAPPGVVAALGDSEHPAHLRHRVVGLLRIDEPEDAHRPPISSLAKKAAAFLRISFSWRRVFTSRLSLRSSSFSSVVSPVRPPESISSWFTQFLRVPSETPIWRAIPGMGCSSSEVLTSRIASRRNSGGYARFVRGTALLSAHCSQSETVHGTDASPRVARAQLLTLHR